MAKVRAVMVRSFQSGEGRGHKRRDGQELQSTSVEVMTILEVIRRHWTLCEARCARKGKGEGNPGCDDT